jgi:hypothetical protein
VSDPVADMRKGVCPKCGASGVRCRREPGWGSDYLAVSVLSSAWTKHYVCVSCGYLENYVDPAALDKIAKKWERAEPAGGG